MRCREQRAPWASGPSGGGAAQPYACDATWHTPSRHVKLGMEAHHCSEACINDSIQREHREDAVKVAVNAKFHMFMFN